MHELWQGILTGIAVTIFGGATAWAFRIERRTTALRGLPERLDRVERLQILTLMKVDPVTAQAELARERKAEASL